jgi:hypothetical protein
MRREHRIFDGEPSTLVTAQVIKEIAVDIARERAGLAVLRAKMRKNDIPGAPAQVELRPQDRFARSREGRHDQPADVPANAFEPPPSVLIGLIIGGGLARKTFRQVPHRRIRHARPQVHKRVGLDGRRSPGLDRRRALEPMLQSGARRPRLGAHQGREVKRRRFQRRAVEAQPARQHVNVARPQRGQPGASDVECLSVDLARPFLLRRAFGRHFRL